MQNKERFRINIVVWILFMALLGGLTGHVLGNLGYSNLILPVCFFSGMVGTLLMRRLDRIE